MIIIMSLISIWKINKEDKRGMSLVSWWWVRYYKNTCIIMCCHPVVQYKNEKTRWIDLLSPHRWAVLFLLTLFRSTELFILFYSIQQWSTANAVRKKCISPIVTCAPGAALIITKTAKNCARCNPNPTNRTTSISVQRQQRLPPANRPTAVPTVASTLMRTAALLETWPWMATTPWAFNSGWSRRPLRWAWRS